MQAGVALLPLLALCASLSGCAAGCTGPLLDVRNCAVECERPASVPLRTWNQSYAMWPHLERLVDATPEGEHSHARWTENQADAFWAFLQVPADAPDKQAFLEKDGDTFRVRVLEC